MTTESSKPLDGVNYDWLALRYVGDEMTAGERAQFEAVLAANQTAREAVAEAVLIFSAVPLALADSTTVSGGPEPVRRAKAPFRARRIGWVAAGVAACLTAGVLAVKMVRDSSLPAGQAIATDGKDLNATAMSELALHWTSLAGDADALGIEANPDAANPDAADSDADETVAADANASHESVDELAAPSWLLAAVSPMVSSPAQNPPSAE